MAERHGIHAGAPMVAALEGHHDQRSGRINQICADYLTMVSELAPELTEAEWCAVADALNGLYAVPVESGAVRHAWAEIADARGLGDKWGIDQEALARRMRATLMPELLAMAEVIRRFWADPSAQPAAEALRKAGARITTEADRKAEAPDEDAPEAGPEWFARARPARDVLG